jgi:hypothetical protein
MAMLYNLMGADEACPSHFVWVHTIVTIVNSYFIVCVWMLLGETYHGMHLHNDGEGDLIMFMSMWW